METKNQPPQGNRAKQTSLIITIVIICVLIGGIAGGWSYITNSKPSWYVKWKIQRYLKQQTGKRGFQTDFQFPSKREMQTVPDVLKTNKPSENLVGKLTKKDIKTLRAEVDVLSVSNKTLTAEIDNLKKTIEQKKADIAKSQGSTSTGQPTSIGTNNTEIANLQSTLASKQEQLNSLRKQIDTYWQDIKEIQGQINAQQQALLGSITLSPTNALVVAQNEFMKKTREKLNQATTYRAMYEAIGQELWVADALLESVNPAFRKVGLGIARQAALDAQNYAENYWLAARIYEGYLLPNLYDATDPNWKMPLSMENILNESVQAFRNVEETNNVIRAYHTMIEKTGGSARADWSRVQLSVIYEQMGDLKSAIKYLKEIQNTNNFAAQLRRIPALEAKLNPQPKQTKK
ncbi:MAG: hypothetical protein ACP5T0_06365 [Verrucomicrobiia bacterium]